MNAFEITGGRRLKGELIPQGAKNEALQVICAVLLTDKQVVIRNIPDIRDVNFLIELLAKMGVKVNRMDANTCAFQADDVNHDFIHSEEFVNQSRKMRG
ncbi:MAG TPA: UDP-N-acetylglucosamine 1-carboxyvinyltransferase, partial [Chitinophagales bacterium]|nr:UDP-N-acetylglucosamine 1-carboxyvinyltransferase [Chitinophagales bacterium]